MGEPVKTALSWVGETNTDGMTSLVVTGKHNLSARMSNIPLSLGSLRNQLKLRKTFHVSQVKLTAVNAEMLNSHCSLREILFSSYQRHSFQKKSRD